MAANVATLKKKAADFEAKKQFDKAIATYREVIDAYDNGDDADIEIALYNRVGDLLTRQGNVPEAMSLYERAVDLYTEGGFFNNAIALCNKVLRSSPGRASIYYKLGKISAKKGFKGEAKQNYLEYADRMQKSGQLDEAFRALAEFADLVPDQDDVRLMLADQLTKAGKNPQALEQLQVLHQRYTGEGRGAEAQATIERMKALDPNFEIKGAEQGGAAKKGADDLIFIDLDAPPKRATRATTAKPVIVEAPSKPTPAPPPPAPEPEPAQEPLNVGGLELISAAMEGADTGAPTDAGGMLGLEATSLGEPEVVVEPEPLAPQEFAELDLSAIDEAVTEPKPIKSDLALGGDLPLLDVGGGTPAGGIVAIELESPASADAGMIELDESLSESVETTVVDEHAGGGDLPIIDVGADDNRRASIETPLEELVVDTPTSFGEVAAEVVDEPPPPVRRSSSLLAANSVMTLRIKVEDEPENWALRRQLGEALLEDGEKDEGIKELEAALQGFDKSNDVDSASSIADEIVRVNPSSVRYHQKRVEYAFRSNDKPRTAEAYLSLADALLRDGQSERARAVYQRVLEIAPGDLRAEAALETFMPVAPPEPAKPAAGAKKGQRYTGAIESVKTVPNPPSATDEGDFVSLGDWLRDEEAPKSTRMVVEEQEPTGDEQADFADMLKKFKQGVAENVEEEDHESHYDLGVAFKEMGLLDEAIAEFQKALRGTLNKARTYEALGQCFLEKKQLPVATTILTRALAEKIGDDQLVGVLYLLGYIHEALNKPAEAKGYYERVFAVDIQFRDVGDRLNAVDKANK